MRKKASVIGVLYKAKILQDEKELSMGCRVRATVKFLFWKISCFFIWTEYWNTDDVTLEEILHNFVLLVFVNPCYLEGERYGTTDMQKIEKIKIHL
jgi:hypothetical protein